jgi:tRNA dimethylallyltransferase
VSVAFEYFLIALAGPTASGKTALALALAEALRPHAAAEIVSCDSVAVYRLMEIGTAKPSLAERARVPHHCLDLYWPDEPCTAGDWARHARAAIADIQSRGRLPIIAGGTGLYLRALLDGLAPAPPRDEALRNRLRSRTGPHLHRILQRLDPAAARTIHANDVPKLIRSLEVTLTAHTPQSAQWQTGRDALTGYNVLRLGLAPDRALLYERINTRAAAMFERGLLEETATLRSRYGDQCRPLGSLGYAQAMQVLRNEIPLSTAIATAQQGHRNYAKRQMTWFRREPDMHWFPGTGDDHHIQAQAIELAQTKFAAADSARVSSESKSQDGPIP